MLGKASYHIEKVEHGVVYLIDPDVGMTITNNAENVVEAVNKLYPNHRIFYLDTDKEWWELKHMNGMFRGFSALNSIV